MIDEELDGQVAEGLAGLREHALDNPWDAETPVPEFCTRTFSVVSLEGVAEVSVKFTRTDLFAFGLPAYILTCSLPGTTPIKLVEAVLNRMLVPDEGEATCLLGDDLVFVQLVNAEGE